jgi:uracil-DNA glycosylase
MPASNSARSCIQRLLYLSSVHAQWRPLLQRALASVDGDYLDSLLHDPKWLPGPDRLLAAFQRDLDHCRYILFGESPYPRRESANGIAFFDAAVSDLWSTTGLSKQVNRATSLRNIIKAALLAQGLITADKDGRISQAAIAAVARRGLISTLPELFDNLHRRGFLLCNATPVLHDERKPAREAIFWRDFATQLLIQIDANAQNNPTLVVWGRIAQQIADTEIARRFPQLSSEHPYNLGFIHNPAMQQLFAELEILRGAEDSADATLK